MTKFISAKKTGPVTGDPQDFFIGDFAYTPRIQPTEPGPLGLVTTRPRGNRRWARAVREGILFLARAVRAPRSVGALIPSGRRLAKAMAAGLPADGEVFVELGGGTGSLTQGLLDSGIAPEKLVVVERDPCFVTHLKMRFPRVQIIEGDGQQLGQLLKDAGITEVCAVVSGLPLRSLPRTIVRRLTQESFSLLKPGGAFVQFTYWGNPSIPKDILEDHKITASRVGHVWLNLPPAHVWRYETPPTIPQSRENDTTRRLSA